MNLGHDFFGHRKRSPGATIYAQTRGQTHEVIAALDIASGTESNSTDGARLHGIVMLFMSLDILAILNTTMSLEIQLTTENNLARTQSI